MMRRAVFLLLLSVFISAGCNSHGVQKTLEDVESYIMERPDSALSVLDTMDRTCLTTDRLKAHHALLHAMALDKNYIDVTNDSIARIAVDYYSRKGPDKYKARALYYLGLSYYYAQDYTKAILEFTKAEKIAEKSDSLYLGLLKLIQCNTYNFTYNEVQESKYAEEAFQLFNEMSADYYLQVAKLNLSRAYSNSGEFEKSEEVLLELLKNSTYDSILLSAKVAYAFDKAVRCKDFEVSSSLFNQAYCNGGASYMSNNDYWVWAYALNNSGQYDKSKEIIERLDREDDSGAGWYWKYLIEKSNGNPEKALSFLEEATRFDNEKVTEVLKQSLSSVQRDYYISLSEIAEYKAQKKNTVMIMIIVVTVFIIAIILWSVSVYVKKREAEKEQYIKYADEIYRQLEAAKKEDYPKLKKKYLEIYRSRFEMISSLYEQYVLYDGKKNAEHAIYTKVSEIINDFIGDNTNRKQLESVLDDSLDGIISQLRKEMSGLKETDYSIFCFMVIGFDATTISHLLNISINAVYIRKSRMKHQIEETNPEHKDRFLDILN